MNSIMKVDVQAFLDEIEQDFSLEKVRQLVLLHKVSGLGLAKALWLAQNHWNGELSEFYDYAVTEWDLKRATVTRYVRVWEFVENVVPDKHRPEFLDQGIKQLIPSAVAYDNGELPELQEQDWEKLAESPDDTTTRAIIRDLKGVDLKSGTLLLQIERTGDITAFQDGQAVYVGFLDLRSDDEIVQRAIRRILNKAGFIQP